MELELHTERIRSIVQAVAGKDPAVDDIFQECCVRLLERHEQWNAQHGAFGAWLGTVVRNVTRSWREREGQRRMISFDCDRPEHSTQDLPFDTESATDPEWLCSDNIAWMLRALKDMPAAQREALVLHYYEDLPALEIAQRLNISASAVSHRLGRALDSMRRHHRRQRWLILLPWPLGTRPWVPLEVLVVASLATGVGLGGGLALGGVTLPEIFSQATAPAITKPSSWPVTVATTSPLAPRSATLDPAELLMSPQHQSLQQLMVAMTLAANDATKAGSSQQLWDELQRVSGSMEYRTVFWPEINGSIRLLAHPVEGRATTRRVVYLATSKGDLFWSLSEPGEDSRAVVGSNQTHWKTLK